MASPARRPDQVPGLPGPRESAAQVAAEPLDQPRDIGWIITLVGAIGTLLASWTLFGLKSDGMWAGYWTSFFGTAAVLGAAWLRSTLPTAPGVTLTALSGIGLILTGALHDYATLIQVPMIAGGAVIVLGAALQAAPRRT
ncbi:MAG: hypothetical protein LH468_09505 [Nocardioides sp.]|nr:hypothetical protein [Nocardioides sp.]